MTQTDTVDFSILYEENYRTVYRFLLKISSDPEIAEDLAQEAFLKAFTFSLNSILRLLLLAHGLVRLLKICILNIIIDGKENFEIYI